VPVRIAFRLRNGVGAQGMNLYEAQWLAYALPYRRFAAVLTDCDARLGADMDRYSFIVSDLHRLLVAGLPAHCERFRTSSAATDGTDILVGRVGPDLVDQAQDPVDQVAANAHCANSFETDRSSSLDFESRWRWPVSYRSIEVLAVIIDILIILSAGVLADTIYRLATTGFASEITDYSAAAAVVAALFASLLKGRGLYKPMALLAWTSQVRPGSASLCSWLAAFSS
jgi:hypothetical protein